MGFGRQCGSPCPRQQKPPVERGPLRCTALAPSTCGDRLLAPGPPFGCKSHDVPQKPSSPSELRESAGVAAGWALRRSAPYCFPRTGKAAPGPAPPRADLLPDACERGPSHLERFRYTGFRSAQA
ncbi:hypothetical protein P7K49_016352 [Saguinus oedipus]|uniref:Uncharacterized protein n=1 Tax=Saguinus oedipus TaxID=9490 RepID=A0ABQ9VDT8_SAGOE|nr:hypothetical protein P7K49_016352 [Saguinus oedipus]